MKKQFYLKLLQGEKHMKGLFIWCLIVCIFLTASCAKKKRVGERTDSSSEVSQSTKLVDNFLGTSETTCKESDSYSGTSLKSIADDVPGQVSPHVICMNTIKLASQRLNLAYKGEYDLSSLVNSDQFSTLIKDYEAYALEDGSVIGYFRYSSSQNVESSDQGDIVTGDGISFVESFVKTESINMNTEWYMENMKNWSFFIISNYKQELIACYMESFMGSVE
ncbi:MAG: hypothetical protein J5476_00870 [Lachnospiraceae bacterium]|nr:hypothetical protein [Lachnospiraceae bacterium]